MLVMKFGGASVAKPESFLKIADLVIERTKQEREIAIVVSAMGNTTDQLLDLARKVHPNPPRREQDMMVSVGERISIALLAMAFAAKGKEAISFTGSQSGIITCENHSEANIIDVKPSRILPVLKKGQIAIIAGFQGVSRKGEITTLGRGGSDTSAVALAVALRAPLVEFYKDVPGIFSADPKEDPKATLIPELSFSDAMQIVEKGAKVLHPRSVALAEKNGIQLSIRSFLDPAGQYTLVGKGAKIGPEMSYEVEKCLPA